MGNLLASQTTNTTSGSTITIDDYDGSDVGRMIWVEGTMDGATVSFMVKPEGCTTYIPCLPTTNSQFTTTGARTLGVHGHFTLRADVSGAGGSTSVSAGVSN